MDSAVPRLALGTVQFGLRYGIANQAGQVNRDDAAAILNHAWANHLDTLDTAIAYGESEQRLGEIGVEQWRVVSKLPALPLDCADVAKWVRESVHGSLSRLAIPRLHGLLLHRSQELLGAHGTEIYRALVVLRGEGKIGKIGVSIYDPEELDALGPRFQLDLVQAPFNVIDRRLAASGWLARLHQAGTEVHTRSAFLQGLLLMEPGRRPAAFSRWQPLWQHWHGWLHEQSMPALQACLGFVLAHAAIERVVVGVDSIEQLKEILTSAAAPAAVPPAALMSLDPDLINPSRWNVH